MVGMRVKSLIGLGQIDVVFVSVKTHYSPRDIIGIQIEPLDGPRQHPPSSLFFKVCCPLFPSSFSLYNIFSNTLYFVFLSISLSANYKMYNNKIGILVIGMEMRVTWSGIT